jgi:hypothetical protein
MHQLCCSADSSKCTCDVEYKCVYAAVPHLRALLLQVLLGEPLVDVWAAATAALTRSRSILGQAANTMAAAATKQAGSSSSRWSNVAPELLALSGPGLSLQQAQHLIAQQAEEEIAAAAAAGGVAPGARAVQQLAKKRPKGLQVWAWLYSAADDAAAEAAQQAEGDASNSSSSSTAQPPTQSRRRRKRSAKQQSNSTARSTNSTSSTPTALQGHAAASSDDRPAGSYSRAAGAVLVLSWRQLQLPQQHPQWGTLLLHQQLSAAWQGPAGSAAAAQAAGSVGQPAGAVVAAADASCQQQTGGTHTAAVAAAVAPNSAVGATRAAQQQRVRAPTATRAPDAAGLTQAGSIRQHHSSSDVKHWAGGVKQRNNQRRLFPAEQCH